MKNFQTLFSSKSTEWCTPVDIFSDIRDAFDIGLDPCAHDTEWLPGVISVTKEQNGLEISWTYNTYINPPYSDIGVWVDKTINEHQKYPKLNYIMLLPSRSDRPWFRRVMGAASAVCFMSKRLKFSNARQNAPFPSLIAVFTGNGEHLTDKQFHLLEKYGYVI